MEKISDISQRVLEKTRNKEEETLNEEPKKLPNIEDYLLRAIPSKYRKIVIEDLDSKEKNEIYDMALEGKSYFFHGGAGTGKTFLACLIGKDLTLKNKNVQYLSFPAFVVRLQSSFRDNEESAYQLLNRYAKEPEVLILDDLGAEGLTPLIQRSIYYIINEREQWDKQIIITSNFSLTEIDEQIDPRISSRIKGICQIVKIGGKDRRLK